MAVTTSAAKRLSTESSNKLLPLNGSVQSSQSITKKNARSPEDNVQNICVAELDMNVNAYDRRSTADKKADTLQEFAVDSIVHHISKGANVKSI